MFENFVARLAEQNVEIERQHEEIIELKSGLKGALADREKLELLTDAQGLDLVDVAREVGRLCGKIQSAVDSLRVLNEVPLNDLERSIEEIVKGLLIR